MTRRLPAILVLTGASGAGKTTLVEALASMQLPGVVCFHCDLIYNDLPEEIRRDGQLAQDAILEYWLRKALAHDEIELAVLETQIRPQRAAALLAGMGIAAHQVVLIECPLEERNRRLHEVRAQPELASAQMECWAAYLRGQADALDLASINTFELALDAAVARLREIAESLRARRQWQRTNVRANLNGSRLVIVCGLPGAGKTTHARKVERELGAIRLCPDEWMHALGINLYDEAFRDRLEKLQWRLAEDLLELRNTVVIEWGTWGRSERDALRVKAQALGAAVELHFLDAPLDVLFERIRARNTEQPPIELEDVQRWSAIFERPTKEEFQLFDGWIAKP